jgi:hypothetical protein
MSNHPSMSVVMFYPNNRYKEMKYKLYLLQDRSYEGEFIIPHDERNNIAIVFRGNKPYRQYQVPKKCDNPNCKTKKLKIIFRIESGDWNGKPEVMGATPYFDLTEEDLM